MKTFKLIFLIPLFFLLVGSEFKKGLINLLSGGAEFLRCDIDGVYYRNNASSFTYLGLTASLSRSNNTFSVGASDRVGDNRKTVEFSINNMNGVCKYFLTGENYGYMSELNGNNLRKFKTDSLNQAGIVNVTYIDTVREVVTVIFYLKQNFI